MRLEYLQYLIEVDKHTSMSEASKALHLTPPTLSIAISKLEEELNSKLIVADNRGTVLTPKGKLLVEKSIEFFNFLAEFKGPQSIDSEPYTISLLGAYGIRDDFLTAFSQSMKNTFPFIIINAIYMNSDMLITEFLSNQYDVGLMYNIKINGTYSYEIPSSIDFVPLFKSNLYCIAHKDSIVADYKTISLNTLFRLQIPIIGSNEQKDAFYNLLNNFATPHKVEMLESYLLLQKRLSNNLGVTISTMSIASANHSPITIANNCIAIKINDDISIHLGYLIRKEPISINLNIFLDYLSSYIHDCSK